MVVTVSSVRQTPRDQRVVLFVNRVALHAFGTPAYSPFHVKLFRPSISLVMVSVASRQNRLEFEDRLTGRVVSVCYFREQSGNFQGNMRAAHVQQ